MTERTAILEACLPAAVRQAAARRLAQARDIDWTLHPACLYAPPGPAIVTSPCVVAGARMFAALPGSPGDYILAHASEVGGALVGLLVDSTGAGVFLWRLRQAGGHIIDARYAPLYWALWPSGRAVCDVLETTRHRLAAPRPATSADFTTLEPAS